MKRNAFKSIILLGFWNLFILNPLIAQIAKWPQYRGPNCSGIAAADQTPPVKIDTATNLLWKIAVAEGHSSPCIWDNRIFLTGIDRDKSELFIFCIDRNTGDEIWRKTITAEQIESVHAISCPANATAATDGESVYVYFGSYGLICYSMDGMEQWELPMPIPKSTHGMGTSPIVSGNLVVLNCCNDQNDPRLIAVNRNTGKLAWKATIPPTDSYFGNEGYSTPVVWNDQIIIYRLGMIEAYNSEDGSLKWWFVTNTDGVSTPIIGENILYVGTFTAAGDPSWQNEIPDFKTLIDENDRDSDSFISEEEFPHDIVFLNRPEIGDEFGGEMNLLNFFGWMDTTNNGVIDSLEWDNTLDIFRWIYAEHGLVAIKPKGKGDITMNSLLWKEVKGVPEIPSPLYHKGRIYMIKNGGLVSCLDATTGSLIYREKLGSSGPYISSPIIADDKLYIASQRGILTVFEIGDSLKILAKSDLNEQIMTTPAIVDNKLYIRTSDSLFAFGD